MLLHIPIQSYSHYNPLPMNRLEISPTALELKGLTRTAHFTIQNPNELLAAAYEVNNGAFRCT